MDIVLALVAALLFALGTVLQQKAGLEGGDAMEGSSSGLLLRMARKPVWLAGIAADALGFVGQAVALTIGRLAVVQPLLATSMVFALPLGHRLTAQRITRSDIAAAILVTASLIAFLTIANPTGGRDDAPVGQWLLLGAILAGVCVPLTLASLKARPAIKATLLGIVTGILFGLSAALTKSVGDEVSDHLFGVFTDWHLYALIAIGYVSMTFNQLALTTGVLAPALAAMMALDPITSVVIGTTLMEESLHETPAGVAATLGALAATIVGMGILARTSQGQAATKPGSGTAVGGARRSEAAEAAGSA
ncbi:MAG: DMT family transporter [Solirubrobacterales bacterium]|nr:DMT family transporter [Solirubrobacterales bacterium]